MKGYIKWVMRIACITMVLQCAIVLFTYRKSNWYGALLYYQNQDTFDTLAPYVVAHPEMKRVDYVDPRTWVPEESMPTSISDAYQAYDMLITKVTGWHSGQIRIFETDSLWDGSGTPEYVAVFLLYFGDLTSDGEGGMIQYEKYLLYAPSVKAKQIKEAYSVYSVRSIDPSWYVVTTTY